MPLNPAHVPSREEQALLLAAFNGQGRRIPAAELRTIAEGITHPSNAPGAYLPALVAAATRYLQP